MKQLIRNILKEETSENDIFKQILNIGIRDSFKLFGGQINLFNTLGVKNEVDFMNLFKGLEKHETKYKGNDFDLYRFEKGNNFFIFHEGYVYIDCEIIQILIDNFGLDFTDRLLLLREWLKNNYNIEFNEMFSTCGEYELKTMI